MAQNQKDFYSSLLADISKFQLSSRQIAQPDESIEKEITKVYTQASRHRTELVRFYIAYTSLFTLFVLGLLGWQAYVRVKFVNRETFEIIPQWALYLLIVGMFAQFIGLLTIVTRRVWDFKSLFEHYQKMSGLNNTKKKN